MASRPRREPGTPTSPSASCKSSRSTSSPPSSSSHHLPAELWEACVTKQTVGALFGTCTASREAAVWYVRKAFALNEKQAVAFIRALHLGQQLFLDGPAGTGKSYLLKKVAAEACERWGTESVAIGAPTGAAAMVASSSLLSAATLHRMFNIRRRCRPPGSRACVIPPEHEAAEHGASVADVEVPASELDQAMMREADGPMDEADEHRGIETAILCRRTRAALRGLRVLILDEVSMVSRRMLELCEEALRVARDRPNDAWGGVALVCSGDFFQLKCIESPASSSSVSPSSPWCFTSPVFPATSHVVRLTELVRQKADSPFAHFLNKLRVGACTEDDLAWFNAQVGARNEGGVPASLMITPSHRKNDKENAERLAALPTETWRCRVGHGCCVVLQSQPWVTARFDQSTVRERVVYPLVPECVELKVGARVRNTRNLYCGTFPDRQLHVANGERGVVESIRADEEHPERLHVCVLFDAIGDMEARRVVVKPVAHARRQRFTTHLGQTIIALAFQTPLVLGWSVTIHRWKKNQSTNKKPHQDAPPTL